MSLNSWSFIGRIGKEAEEKFTPGGDAIVSFSVAVDSGFGDKKVTTWVRATMWGKRGSAVKDCLLKGTQVGIVGEVTLREFTNKDGNKQSSLEVRVNDLTLLGGKKEGESQSRPAPQQSGSEDSLDQDIPF